MHASCDKSSFPCSFFRSGCFSGSLEYLHNSSCLRRLAVDRDKVLDNVRLGGGLKILANNADNTIHCLVIS